MKKQTQFNLKQSQFKPNKAKNKPKMNAFITLKDVNSKPILERQTGQIPELLIRLLWSHNKFGPFNNFSGQYLHMTHLLLTLLVGENAHNCFFGGGCSFVQKRHIAHKFLGGGNAMKKRKTNQLKLWAIGVLAIVLLAAPSGWTITTYDDGKVHELDTDLNDDMEIKAGTTVNLRATVSGYIQAHPGSVLNIYSGSVFWYVVVSSGQPEPQVSIYGTGFAVDGVATAATEFLPIPGDGSVLTGTYGNGDPIEPTMFQLGLWFFSDIPIKLLPPESDDDVELTIDIKPGSDTNCINLKSRGVVPVAVLTTDDFNAGTLVPDYSILFAGASSVHTTLRDVDEDGDMDMLFHFRTQKLVELNEDSTEATLTATLTSTFTRSSALTAGDVIQGTDKVKVMKSYRKKYGFSSRYTP
jgi:hypothetical protein